MSEQKWTAEDVIEHLRKVREYHKIDPYKVLDGREIARLLEDYDKVHPITLEQANAVCDHVIAHWQQKLNQRN